jgi:hypothetical protein
LEVDVQQGNFKILRLLPQVLILFLVEKWIPPSRSETAEIGQKNRRNFRGYARSTCTSAFPILLYLFYLCFEALLTFQTLNSINYNSR